MATIKVGFLISYDYEFIKISLPRVYSEVEEIYFAVDVNGLTWSGEPIVIADEFWDWVNEFDIEKKIRIYRDHFYVDGLTPMECDTRERNLLGKQMGEADWYVQIDSDEYFDDFPAFAQKLREFKPSGPVTIGCKIITLFKHVAKGYLFVAGSREVLDFATNNPIYDIARNNTSGNEQIEWEDLVLHQSWARTPEEIYLKLHNWSHKDDFNVESFFKLWNAIDEHNFHVVQNFHPLAPGIWPSLKYVEGGLDGLLNFEVEEPEVSVKRKPLLSRLWKEIKGR
ncbi:hypothetical protein [Pedobacter sp. GR22-6]|uniref:hypothetical protein n=1 Tax=Pedobacter sp. GR22-6 TaxID=3127957 RepID=UPI00307DA037